MIDSVFLNGFSSLFIIPALIILVVFFVGVAGFVGWIHSLAKHREHANPKLSTVLVCVGIVVWIMYLSVIVDLAFGFVLTIVLIVMGFSGWLIYREAMRFWGHDN